HVDLARGRVGGELLRGQRIVGTAHAAGGRGFATLGNSHDTLRFNASSATRAPRTGWAAVVRTRHRPRGPSIPAAPRASAAPPATRESVRPRSRRRPRAPRP